MRLAELFKQLGRRPQPLRLGVPSAVSAKNPGIIFPVSLRNFFVLPQVVPRLHVLHLQGRRLVGGGRTRAAAAAAAAAAGGWGQEEVVIDGDK